MSDLIVSDFVALALYTFAIFMSGYCVRGVMEENTHEAIDAAMAEEAGNEV